MTAGSVKLGRAKLGVVRGDEARDARRPPGPRRADSGVWCAADEARCLDGAARGPNAPMWARTLAAGPRPAWGTPSAGPRVPGALVGTAERGEATARTEAAAAYHAGEGRLVVASGGRRWGPHAEATRMKAALVEAGVPAGPS